MRKKSSGKFTFFFVFSLFNLIAFFSCSAKSEIDSLSLQLETVDSLISTGQFSDAVKDLKKIEKKLYDSWSCIGVYKRYVQLGENELAEKLIRKSLKKNPDNLELNAILSKFLINKNSLDEAENFAKKLQGTDYGSIYSEVVLKKAFRDLKIQDEAKNQNETKISSFLDEKFYQIYFDAYKGGKNNFWLRNCALLNLRQGIFKNAAAIIPLSFENADDAYFWSLVKFDAGEYSTVVQILEISERFLRGFPAKIASSVKISALKSDSYMMLSQMQMSEDSRKEIVFDVQNVKTLDSEDEDLLPVLMLNSAVFAENNFLNDDAANLLFYIVNRWPNYSHGLIRYADFAYKNSIQKEEDYQTQELRKAGITTIQMEIYDNRKKIPVSDAIYRIEKSLEENKNAELSVALTDLKFKTDSTLNEKDKNTAMWNLLEDNSGSGKEYQSEIVRYVINYFLKTAQFEQAESLFRKYIFSVKSFNAEEDFWSQFISQLRAIELPFAEFGAFFAEKNGLHDETVRILEYCVYESAGILENGIISPEVSFTSCMNLADIYFADGKNELALELYGKTAGRESSLIVRSEIFTRIAKIYLSEQNFLDAKRAAEYASELNAQNVKAGLVKSQIRQAEKNP